MSIKYEVQKIISKKPFIEEGLERGIINIASLAQEIIPEIEEQLGKNVTFPAVNMALRRISESLILKDKTDFNIEFSSDTDITIKTNVVVMTFYKIENLHVFLKKVYDVVSFEKGDFISISQGLHEIMIITNRKYEKKIIDIFPFNTLKNKVSKLGVLIINLPEQATETVGYFYQITKKLSWENINIIDVISTYTELMFILEEKNLSKGLTILNTLVKDFSN